MPLKSALRAADVLGTDDTPASLGTGAATSADGRREPARLYGPHQRGLYRRRAGPDPAWRLLVPAPRRPSPASGSWTATAGSWSATTTAATSSYGTGLAGVQQCVAHLYRYLDDAYATDPQSQVWTAGDALRRMLPRRPSPDFRRS